MAAAAAAAASESGDGPVMSLINKKLRALRKKHNKILLLEESISNGKTLNKDQEEVLRTKPSVLTLIDEYERLRQPLSAALQEELSTTPTPPPPPPPESALEDLLKLLYFGVLFDLKPQTDFTNIMLTRTHERGCCLTYDYVTDDASSDLLLGERDFDLISMLGGKIVSRPVHSGLSHKNALQSCLQHAKLWLANSEQPIEDGVDITYAALRERLNKILASDYFITTPEMKAPVEVAAAAGKYVPVQASSVSSEVTESDCFAQSEPKEEETEHSEGQETGADLIAFWFLKNSCHFQEESEVPSSADGISAKHEIKPENYEEQQDFRDVESKDQQYSSRRGGYQNYRGGNRGGGGGRRGYPNGRGGRNNRGGGYQNGRGQYNDQSGYYYPRNYLARGRGGAGRGGGGNGYNNHGSVGGSHAQGEEQQY